MINKEEFELHKNIVNWLVENGSPFQEAIAIVSFSHQSDRSIPEAYFELKKDGWRCRKSEWTIDHEK